MKVPIEKLLDQVDWKPTGAERLPDDPEIPVATHEGILKILDMEIPVVQLDNGMRLITEEGFENFLKWLDGTVADG